MQTAAEPGAYMVGVMTVEAEGKDSVRFRRRVEEATRVFEIAIASALGVRVELLSFEGPHLTPVEGAYQPLDFLRLGMAEKLERDANFLLIVTEVDLATTTPSFTLALPSQLTNVAVVSTKRLEPRFWGRDDEEARATDNLATLLLHSFGHLLNLPHSPDPSNAMFAFASLDDLPAMRGLTKTQRAAMRRALPLEAHERVSRGSRLNHLRFALAMLWRDRSSIARAVWRANPLRLARRLPTMITAALSVVIVLFFSPEPWDVGSTVELWQLVVFALIAVFAASAALYRTFAFSGLRGRGQTLAESSVVTAAAVAASLVLTMLTLLIAFACLCWAGAETVFPRKLMETWPTVDPAVRTLDHVKMSLFIAAFATLAGSLGGRADRRDLVRGVLFVDEEM